MSDKTAQGKISEQGEVLKAFSRTLDRVAHTLTKRPDLPVAAALQQFAVGEGSSSGFGGSRAGAKQQIGEKAMDLGKNTFWGIQSVDPHPHRTHK